MHEYDGKKRVVPKREYIVSETDKATYGKLVKDFKVNFSKLIKESLKRK